MKEAERETGISSIISAVTSGKFQTTNGYIWRLGDGKKRTDIETYYASTRKHLVSISRPIVKYLLDGKRLAEFPSIAEAARIEDVRAWLIVFIY